MRVEESMLPNAQVLGKFESGHGDLLKDVSACDEWDADNFQDIFARLSKPIMSFLFGMLGDYGLAEELTQETFVRAFGKLDEKFGEARLSAWLFGIARNVAREAIKAKYRNRFRELSELNEQRDVPRAESQPEEQLMSGELNIAIQRALAKLPDDYRVVFVLKIINQMRYDEISVVTGFSIGKLKTDLHRARYEMRKGLMPYLSRRDLAAGGM
jgi:RNA polymerase sigma-70 factor (ECF subfamily)